MKLPHFPNHSFYFNNKKEPGIPPSLGIAWTPDNYDKRGEDLPPAEFETGLEFDLALRKGDQISHEAFTALIGQPSTRIGHALNGQHWYQVEGVQGEYRTAPYVGGGRFPIDFFKPDVNGEIWRRHFDKPRGRLNVEVACERFSFLNLFRCFRPMAPDAVTPEALKANPDVAVRVANVLWYYQGTDFKQEPGDDVAFAEGAIIGVLPDVFVREGKAVVMKRGWLAYLDKASSDALIDAYQAVMTCIPELVRTFSMTLPTSEESGPEDSAETTAPTPESEKQRKRRHGSRKPRREVSAEVPATETAAEAPTSDAAGPAATEPTDGSTLN